MRKRFLLLLLFIFLSVSMSAAVSTDVRGTLGWTYDTNAFSNPLPQGYPIDSGYPNGGEFLQRHNQNIGCTADLIFTSDSRIGLSIFANLGIPVHSRSIIPEGEGYDWDYVVYDSLSSQDLSLFLGVGPLFRYNIGQVELLLPVRFSVGSYDWFTTGFVVGVVIEPTFQVFVTDDVFISFSMLYDAHLMKLFYSTSQVYDYGYIMLTAGVTLGAGFRFGGGK